MLCPDVTRIATRGLKVFAERAAVELGTRRDGQVVIVSGLATGDTIVTSGTHKVFEGGGVQSPDAVPAVSGTP